MSEIEIGDRVRVEFEATVTAGGPGPVEVTEDDGCSLWVDSRWCTVIAPAIKVGDVVTADNIGQLPDGSIVSARGWAPYIKFGGEWFEINRRKLFESSERAVLAHGAPTVAVIGGGS